MHYREEEFQGGLYCIFREKVYQPDMCRPGWLPSRRKSLVGLQLAGVTLSGSSFPASGHPAHLTRLRGKILPRHAKSEEINSQILAVMAVQLNTFRGIAPIKGKYAQDGARIFVIYGVISYWTTPSCSPIRLFVLYIKCIVPLISMSSARTRRHISTASG